MYGELQLSIINKEMHMPNNTEEITLLTHEQAFPLHSAELKRISEQVDALEDLGTRSIEVVSKLSKSLEYAHERIGKSEAQTEAIIRLGTSVEHMVTEVKGLSEQVKEVVTQMADHEHRITDFEKSTIKEDIKNINDKFISIENSAAKKVDLVPITDKLIILENAAAKKIASYVDNTLKAVLVVAVLAFIYYLSDGKIGR